MDIVDKLPAFAGGRGDDLFKLLLEVLIYMEKLCKTCTKKRQYKGYEECSVLKEMIGREKECWAWSDDPDWLKKVQEAVENYAGERSLRLMEKKAM